MTADPRSLFSDLYLPEGFQFQAELMSGDEERRLIESLKQLPFSNLSFTVSSGIGELFPSVGAMILMSESWKRRRPSRLSYWGHVRRLRTSLACLLKLCNTAIPGDTAIKAPAGNRWMSLRSAFSPISRRASPEMMVTISGLGSTAAKKRGGGGCLGKQVHLFLLTASHHSGPSVFRADTALAPAESPSLNIFKIRPW
jgi:hypothetical protein